MRTVVILVLLVGIVFFMGYRFLFAENWSFRVMPLLIIVYALAVIINIIGMLREKIEAEKTTPKK